MDLKVLKILFLFVFFLEAMVMGLIPVYCKAFSESPVILGIANAFSGGVFLAICLMHIMPEQVEAYAGIQEEKGLDDSFPMPFFLCIIGYTIILVIDKVLFDTHVIFDDHEHDDEGKPSGAPRMSILKQASISQSIHKAIKESEDMDI
jgi:zinc transporter 1/2/3